MTGIVAILESLIPWSIITIIFIVLGVAGYKWLSGVARFESRKKELAAGFLLFPLMAASFMFAPLLFFYIDLHSLGNTLICMIQCMEEKRGNMEITRSMVPFIKPLLRFLSAASPEGIKLAVIGIPAFITVVNLFGVFFLLLTLRAPRKNHEDGYKRKHLFEYKPDILSKLNQKSQG